jgi:hypothetical protein
MPTIEAHLRREMHKYAVEIRKLAYTFPNRVESTISSSCRS